MPVTSQYPVVSAKRSDERSRAVTQLPPGGTHRHYNNGRNNLIWQNAIYDVHTPFVRERTPSNLAAWAYEMTARPIPP